MKTHEPLHSPPFRVEFDPVMGRCLVAKRFISRNELVCDDPVIVLNARESKLAEKTVLLHYTFTWWNTASSSKCSEATDTCVVLGYGSLFNHSDSPNVQWMPSFQHRRMTFRACKDILPGEQLFVNYGYTPKPDDPAMKRLEGKS